MFTSLFTIRTSSSSARTSCESTIFPEGSKPLAYYDHSIWESAKTTSPLALKRLINKELEGTSVTAILIGSQTYARRWVRYEIIKSIERNNRVIGIHINGIAGKDKLTKPLGTNPFDHLGLEFGADGKRVVPTEWLNGKWQAYGDLDPWTVPEQPLVNRGKHFQLSHGRRVYDWVANRGFENFSSWIE